MIAGSAVTQTERRERRGGIPNDPFLWLALLLIGGMLGGLSMMRYTAYSAAMLDLGNMFQAISSVWREQPLLVTTPAGNVSRMAGHVEIFFLLFAPLVALWPDPRVLLIGQALLFTLGAIPVYRLALRRIESRFAARCLVLIYLLYPVAQTAVLFDFHGDTLAMPLLLFALDALDRRSWLPYWLFLALALSSKLYVALPVALLGGLVWFIYGEQRVGLATSILAGCYGALAFLVIRPLFAVENGLMTQTSSGYLSHYFGSWQELLATLDQRILSMLIVFGPALFIAWRGWRWLIPALPVAAAALISTGPGGAFDYRYHHYALVVPFVLMASIDGVLRLQGRALGNVHASPGAPRRRRNWIADLGLTTLIVFVFLAALVDVPFNPQFWLNTPGMGFDSSAYGRVPRDGLKDRFLAAEVPPAVPIAASTFLASHLANRDTVYLTRYADDPGAMRLPELLPQVDYVLTDALFDYYVPLDGGAYGGGIWYERDVIQLMLRNPQFGLVSTMDGLLLFERTAPIEQRLTTSIEILPDGPEPALIRFGDALELVEYTATVRDAGRVELEYRWRVLRSLEQERIFAVTRFAEMPELRFVHLPGLALLPVEEWPAHAQIRERFVVDLPPELASNELTLQVGWYEAETPYSALTDSRSAFADSEEQIIATFSLIEAE